MTFVVNYFNKYLSWMECVSELANDNVGKTFMSFIFM